MKKLLLLVLFPAALTLQGCDDETVAAGVGFAGGVLVGSQIDHGRTCHRTYRNRCTTGWDYFGRPMRQCRRVYSSCSYRHYNEGLGIMDAKAVVTTDREADLAKRYGMSFDSARKVVSAFDRGEKKDFNGFASIGISRGDMRDIYDGRMLPRRTMDTLAKTLDMSPNSTQKMMKDIITKVQKKRAELEAR
ncbi:MAG TPA: hypothetical protein PL182_08875 [Pseudobdellovibrionaceae bacterium]|nr:hypothetical protein [Pseudobdellovibrionaceae bacterium]